MIAVRGARPTRAPTIPRTRAVGLCLAAATATISGVSVFINATAVKHVPDAAVFTTLKNAVALVLLLAVAVAVVRPGGGPCRRCAGSGPARHHRHARRRRRVPALLLRSGDGQCAVGRVHPQDDVPLGRAHGGPVPRRAPGLGADRGARACSSLGQVLILPPLGITWGTGETLIAIATGLWAVEVVLARRVLGRVRSPIVGVARLGIGLVVLVGFLVVTGRIAGIADLDGTAWLWIAITGLFLSGYVGTWLAALRRAPATEVTSILVVGAVITGALTADLARRRAGPDDGRRVRAWSRSPSSGWRRSGRGGPHPSSPRLQDGRFERFPPPGRDEDRAALGVGPGPVRPVRLWPEPLRLLRSGRR